MRFGSLFSGVGGIDLGLTRAGMECAWQVEIDPFCRKVLAKHWPDVPKWDDVRTFPPEPLEAWNVDLIAGGFPCQPHSVAGKRLGENDERDLWPHFRRTIRLLNPRWVVAENVVGLLSNDAGRFFGGVLRDLANIGHDAEWSVISACAMGAPHTRERVFLVSNANGVLRSKRLGVDGNQFAGLQQGNSRQMQSDWLASVTANSGSANGIPNWSHRCKSLGNAVVPQIAEWLGRRILAADRT